MSGYYFTPTARADLESHQDYIARDRPLASLAWVERLGERCRTLAQNPGWVGRATTFAPIYAVCPSVATLSTTG